MKNLGKLNIKNAYYLNSRLFKEFFRKKVNTSFLSRLTLILSIILGIIIVSSTTFFTPRNSESSQLNEANATLGEGMFNITIIDVPFLTDLEIRNPEIARKYGVKGYLEIKLTNISSARGRPVISGRKGKETRIPLLLHYVSYDEKFNEIKVVLDPMGPGLSIIKVLPNGEEVLINRYVRYEPSGALSIKHNQTIEVIMIVEVPKGFPLTIFDLGAVGIYTEPEEGIAMINDTSMEGVFP